MSDSRVQRLCIKFCLKFSKTTSERHVTNSLWWRCFIRSANVQVIFKIQRQTAVKRRPDKFNQMSRACWPFLTLMGLCIMNSTSPPLPPYCQSTLLRRRAMTSTDKHSEIWWNEDSLDHHDNAPITPACLSNSSLPRIHWLQSQTLSGPCSLEPLFVSKDEIETHRKEIQYSRY